MRDTERVAPEGPSSLFGSITSMPFLPLMARSLSPEVSALGGWANCYPYQLLDKGKIRFCRRMHDTEHVAPEGPSISAREIVSLAQ